jgi:hypothetical protein
MGWFILVEGTSDEPSSSDWEEIASYPTPREFFYELFMEVCDIDVRKEGRVTKEIHIPGEERIIRGFQGTEGVGFHWAEEECLETSMIPVHVRCETYGLPGMEIRWYYYREYAGQLGHAAFRNGSLTARFDNEEALAQFEGIWFRVFGKNPVFQPEGY